MYRVSIKGNFSAAHRLTDYKGKCENLHGHNWAVEVCMESGSLDNQGMVIDFTDIKSKLAGILKELDHKYINELSEFKVQSPTSERLAEFIYCRMKGNMKLPEGIKIKNVSVWESETSKATYIPNNNG